MKPQEAKANAPVWINGERLDGVAAAAARISLLLGWKVAEQWVSALVEAGTNATINGVSVSAAPPEAKPATPVAGELPAIPRQPLLRYPAGEAPIDRGAPHAGP